METERMETEGLLTESVKTPEPYIFFNDPGHGWLQVRKAELVELGIADKISSYSYMNATFAYLEEDCDAGVFLRAKYGEDVSFATLEKQGVLKERYGCGFVRHYPHYQV